MDQESAPVDRSLELSAEALQELVDAAMVGLCEFLHTLPHQPAWNSLHAREVAQSVIQPLPESGQPREQVLRRLFHELIPIGLNTAGPGYLAYIPGGGLPHAAVADLIAGTVNRYIGIWQGAPGLAQLEATVIRWFCEVVGYPPAAAGFFTSGGSLSLWSALVAARGVWTGDDLRRATLYTSDQAHHAIIKAALFAGLPPENLRLAPVAADFRVRVDKMAEQIRNDRLGGFQPLAIVGHAGTTNTGAVDDLEELADLAQSERLWLHVDGAYGGFFLLTPRGRELMRGIERADSITLDPHKSLFLPYGTGCLLVRDREHLLRTHQLRGEYMTVAAEAPEFVDFCDLSPELTRSCRGLRVWLPIQLHGIGPFRRNLDEKLDLARWLTAELQRLGGDEGGQIEIVAAPQLSILAFRLVRPGLGDAQLDDLNQRFRDRINATQKVLLSPTRLHGRYVIRICVLSFRTHYEHVSTCLGEIARALREV